MSMAEYFFELLTEEIPAWMHEAAHATLLTQLTKLTQELGEPAGDRNSVVVNGTPRRIIFFLPNIPLRENDREEERLTDPHVGSSCSAQITRQQERAKKGRLWNGVEESADQHHHSNRHTNLLGVSEVGKCFYPILRSHQPCDAAEDQKQYNQTADDAPGPKTGLRDGSSLRSRFHEYFPQSE